MTKPDLTPEQEKAMLRVKEMYGEWPRAGDGRTESEWFFKPWAEAEATLDDLERKKLLRSGKSTVHDLQDKGDETIWFWLTPTGKEWVKGAATKGS